MELGAGSLDPTPNETYSYRATKFNRQQDFDANAETPRKLQKVAKLPKSNRSSFHQRTATFLGASKYLIFPTAVYIITVYCAATSSHRYSLLGLFSAERSILILHILSKIGDIALSITVDAAWKSVKWAITARNKPASLATIFALSAGTGLFGLVDIVNRGKSPQAHTARLWGSLRYFIVLDSSLLVLI